MLSIHKFVLKVVEKQYVDMPLGSTILSIQAQGTNICMWAEVDLDEAEKERHAIYVYKTGEQYEELKGEYIDSLVHDGHVWHVYEEEIEIDDEEIDTEDSEPENTGDDTSLGTEPML